MAGQRRRGHPDQRVVEYPVWMVPHHGQDSVRRGGLQRQLGERGACPRLQTHRDPAAAADANKRLLQQVSGVALCELIQPYVRDGGDLDRPRHKRLDRCLANAGLLQRPGQGGVSSGCPVDTDQDGGKVAAAQCGRACSHPLSGGIRIRQPHTGGGGSHRGSYDYRSVGGYRPGRLASGAGSGLRAASNTVATSAP